MIHYKIFELEANQEDSTSDSHVQIKLREFTFSEIYIFRSMDSAQEFINTRGVDNIDYAIIPIMNKNK